MEHPSSAHVTEALRRLPAVDHLLNHPAVANLQDEYPREELIRSIREVLDARRADIRAGREVSIEIHALALEIRQMLHRRSRSNLRRVINATGIVLHTGLGRAPLAEEALAAVAEVARGYCNLELDLDSGERGDRHEHVRDLLRELTGAADALVVNNNAAATVLALHALAGGREAIISRGELVEIGGSYRMPEVMAAAGCRMVEIGTTNRTHLRDYERAIGPQTAAIVRVHTSNYQVCGFVAKPALGDLGKLTATERVRRSTGNANPHLNDGDGPWLIDDLGSGVLDASFLQGPDGAEPGWNEPTVRQSIVASADLTLFSGDKLLGGPQAGIVLGRTELISRLRSDPLTRAFRPDKMQLAALEATLRLYRDPATAAKRIPALRMLMVKASELQRAAEDLAAACSQQIPEAEVLAVPDESYMGGGSLPAFSFPTWVVRVRVPGVRAIELAAALRQRDLPVIGRVHNEALILDCRPLLAEDMEAIPAALAEVLRDGT